MQDYDLALPSYAKINLGLRVLGKRSDGYHAIETIFQELEFHDMLYFRKHTETLTLESDNHDLPLGKDNLVHKAIQMSIVLWNTGLMSGIRRYGEMGVRLAIGEAKGHVYKTVIYESVLIGILGSILGTILGLGAAYYLQEVGIDVSTMMQGASMLMSSVLRAKITPPAFYIGFIPGVLATVLGSLMAGVGIFKRQTSQLFKELEV